MQEVYWFGIEIVDVINNGLKVKRFIVKDNSTGSNSKIRRKPRLMSNKTLKNIDNDDNKINKEIIFTKYFANNGNGNVSAKLIALNKLLQLLEEKRAEIKDFNPKLGYDIFIFLQHTKYRNSLTYQEDRKAEKRLDKVFKKLWYLYIY